MHPDLAAFGKWSTKRMGLAIGFKGASEPFKNASASSVVISRLAEFETAVDEGKRIAGAEVLEEPNAAREFLAEAGWVAGVIRIETAIPKLTLTTISASFVLKNRTRVKVLLGKSSASKGTLSSCVSLRLLVLSMGLLCGGSMMTLEGKQLETTS